MADHGSPRRPAHAPPRHPASRAWNDDWHRLAVSREGVEALERWRREDPLLDQRDLATLLVVSGAGAPAPTQHADDVLGALVRRAATDRIAARTVIQRVLPGLIAVAGRRAGIERRPVADVLGELTATAWTAIVTYPVERRPGKYAVNIVRDAEYLSFVRPRRLRRVPEHLIGDDVLRHLAPRCGLDGRHGHRNPSEVVHRLLERARCSGLPADDLALLRALYVDDHSVEALAVQHSVTGRAIRYRREAALTRLAQCA